METHPHMGERERPRNSVGVSFLPVWMMIIHLICLFVQQCGTAATGKDRIYTENGTMARL